MALKVAEPKSREQVSREERGLENANGGPDGTKRARSKTRSAWFEGQDRPRRSCREKETIRGYTSDGAI
jgi:hypothetical protein